ncbi:MAG: orotidine-5'-phosphate decarboxylase [Deltaproteobacteria bacterium]|nr:orotidine-5'-phosphate decarboxylase [Deltaproteobacteria bacterium]
MKEREASTVSFDPRGRIIFALDVPNTGDALRYARLLKDHVGVFKVGLELFVSAGPEVVKAVHDYAGCGVFLDLKFHDIPATVIGAMRSASGLGVRFATVHTSDGASLLRAAVEAAAGVKVLGVTVLTSLGQADLAEAGIDPAYKEPLDLVLHRARLAKESGCAGVVCSGREASAVRKTCGKDFVIVTPGIRGKDDHAGDQRRVVTAYDAVKNGADYVVVGRPIRDAKDPQKAAGRIASEIERAHREMGG